MPLIGPISIFTKYPWSLIGAQINTTLVAFLFIGMFLPNVANAIDTQAPTIPRSLTGAIIGVSQVELSWIGSTDLGGGNLAGYDVYRNNKKRAANVITTTYIDDAVEPGQIYSYRIDAFDDADPRNKSAKSNIATVEVPNVDDPPGTPDTQAPTIPENLTGVMISASRVELSWAESTDLGGGNLAGYDVYRNDAKRAANVITTTYIDDTVESGQIYSYRVDAFDDAGPRNKSAKSNVATVGVPSADDPSGATDTRAPTIPENLTGTVVSASRVELSWDASTDLGGGNLAGYDVYRNNAKRAGNIIDTTYVDDTVEPGQAYSYRIDAFDDADPRNKSAKSNAASISIPLDAAPCVGARIQPTGDAVAIVQNSPPGTTFCFEQGVHYLSNRIYPRTGDQFIGHPGAILDGRHTASTAFYGYSPTGAKNVTIRGLIIQNFQGSFETFSDRQALKAGVNWLVEDNEIRYNSETGIHVGGQNSILRNNKIHHNGRLGISVGPGLDQNILFEGNEIAYNNERNMPWSAAGSVKVFGSTIGATGLIWKNNWIHHNNGHGLHHDGNTGPDIEISGNLIEHNVGNGIQHEASWGVDIHDNHLYNNAKAYVGKSCFHGSQIHNNNSSDVFIYNNHIESDEGANGICMVDTDSHNYFPFSETVTNSSVTNNTIKLVGIAQNGLVGNGEFAPYDTGDVFFDRNTYYLPDPSGGAHWRFLLGPYVKVEWRELGQDLSSLFLTH